MIGQWFAWTEIVRREIRFLDLADDEKTKQLSVLLEEVAHWWRTDLIGREFMIWTGEQRAVGETMTVEGSDGSECMGYAQFLEAIDAGRADRSGTRDRPTREECRLRPQLSRCRPSRIGGHRGPS